jgi:hypothetical protein
LLYLLVILLNVQSVVSNRVFLEKLNNKDFKNEKNNIILN